MSQETINLVRDSTVQETNEILSQIANQVKLDGTVEGYNKAMRKWFLQNGAYATTEKGLTELCNKWYTITREPWNGGVKFEKASAVSTGTKIGDNADLVCEPSTDKKAGRDDYAGLPLFACVDCNFTIDQDTQEPLITAISGVTENFQRYDPNHFVGVLQMTGFFYTAENDESYIEGYSSTINVPYANVEPLNEAIRPNKEVRPWVVHAKYMHHTVDNKLTSYAGVLPTCYSISHNSVQTLAKATGKGWATTTSADDAFLKIMLHIKYASLASDGIIQGCCNNYRHADVKVEESDTKRLIVSEEEGAPFEPGMGILVGTTSATEEWSSEAYTISTQAGFIITSIEKITIEDTQYIVINTDATKAFITTTSTRLWAFHWINGSTDGVLGNDGSLGNNTSGKYPAKLQGIEYMTGAWEVMGDVILNLYQDEQDSSYWYEPYICRDPSKYSTTEITADYKASGIKLKQPDSSSWNYIVQLMYKAGLFFPINITGGSSTTYTKDQFYALANTTGLKEFLLRGSLYSGLVHAGLSAGSGDYDLGLGSWPIAARASASGNRGEWAA